MTEIIPAELRRAAGIEIASQNSKPHRVTTLPTDFQFNCQKLLERTSASQQTTSSSARLVSVCAPGSVLASSSFVGQVLFSNMDNLISLSRLCTLATMVLLLLAWNNGAADSVRYNPVSREVIETRLEKYAGNDQKREATLKQLFTEAGCDDQHLSEQPVKGSKLPNVVCLLPGSSDRVINRWSALRPHF